MDYSNSTNYVFFTRLSPNCVLFKYEVQESPCVGEECTSSLWLHTPEGWFKAYLLHTLPKGSQSSNSKAIEKDMILNLKNLFETLSQQDDLVCASEAGECSGGNGDDRDRGDQLESLDTDSEVEEVYVEPMPKFSNSGNGLLMLVYVLRAVILYWDETPSPIERRQLWADLGCHKLVVREYEWYQYQPVYRALSVRARSLARLLSARSTLFREVRREEALFESYDKQVAGHSMYHIVSKLKSLQLRKLIHDQGNLHDRVNKLRHELDEVQKALDLNPTDSVLKEEEVVYVHAFNEAKLDEERFLKQKAKVEWLQVGDSNSAYFHKSVKSRNQRCPIEMYLGSAMACTNLNIKGLFTSKVSESSYLNMVRHVSDLEIKEAMFSIGDNRALGLDGYNSAFLKKDGIL
ncbi:hypothetical protein Tco_1266826 [Tanacetum coccineum]